MTNMPPAGALITAAKDHNRLEVSRLLQRGADVNERDALGRSALYHAANRGNLEIVRVLLDDGANIDSRDKNGDTALMGAVAGYGTSREAIVKLLTERGANIDIKNNNNETVRSIATKKNRGDIIKILEGVEREQKRLAEEFERTAADRRRAEVLAKQQRLKELTRGGKLKPGPGPKPPQAA